MADTALPAIGEIGDISRIRAVFYQSGRLVHGPYGLSTLGVSPFMETLLDDADAGEALSTLGFSAFVQSLRDSTNASDLRGRIGVAYSDLPWLSVPIGGIVELPTNLTGVTEPPTDSTLYRFAKLTAGLTGSGAYNNGVLGSESVSGSAPLVQATASVTLSGSPMSGQTIRLLNSEMRMIRPGTSPGTVRADQFQDHNHAQIDRSSASGTSFGTGFAFGSAAAGNTGFASALGYRAGSETYPKHIEMTFYMRVK